jgi:hypothetical protein
MDGAGGASNPATGGLRVPCSNRLSCGHHASRGSSVLTVTLGLTSRP